MLIPNWALGRTMYGLALVRAGQFDEAVSETDHALRMSPLDTFAGLYTVFHGLALLSARRFPEALVYLRKSIQAYPDFIGNYSTLISCCGHLGLIDEAQMYLRQHEKIAGVPLRAGMSRQALSQFAHAWCLCGRLAKGPGARMKHLTYASACMRRVPQMHPMTTTLQLAVPTWLRIPGDTEPILTCSVGRLATGCFDLRIAVPHRP